MEQKTPPLAPLFSPDVFFQKIDRLNGNLTCIEE